MRPRTVPSGGEGLSASEGRACGGRLRPAGVMVVDGSAAGCPAGPLPRCPMTPAAVAGVPIAVRSRAIGVHKPRPLSACPHRRCPPAAPACPVTTAAEQARERTAAHRCWDGDCRASQSAAAAAAREGVRLGRHPDTAAASAVCCCLRTRPGVRTAAVRCGPCGQSHRESSPGRCPLIGRRRGRTSGRAGGRAGRGATPAPRSSPAAPVPGPPRRSAPRTGGP